MMKTQVTNRVLSRVKIEKKRRCSDVHYHKDHELYFLLEGDTKYFIGDEVFRLYKGDIIFIPKGVSHRTDSETCLNIERYLVSFDDDIFDESMLPILEKLNNEKLIYIPKSKQNLVKEAFRKIEKESKKDKPYKDAMLKTHIRELVILIARLQTDEQTREKRSDQTIYNIINYISSHFAEELSLKMLSHKFGFCESHLSKKFKAVTGFGINEYINYVRILNAEKLLLEAEDSITEIAQKCGFNDSNYFSTVFKRFVGLTPLKYRMENEPQNTKYI